MITLKKITHQNLDECIYKVKTTQEQTDFVASNVESLAEAYTSIANGGFATPYAVYNNDDVMVGFVMYTFFNGADAVDISDPQAAPESYKSSPCYYIWRILIDRNQQGKGYGKQAIAKIIDEIKTIPHGKADRIYTSWAPDNVASKMLFESFGFVETGEIDGRQDDDYEVVSRLDISILSSRT